MKREIVDQVWQLIYGIDAPATVTEQQVLEVIDYQITFYKSLAKFDRQYIKDLEDTMYDVYRSEEEMMYDDDKLEAGYRSYAENKGIIKTLRKLRKQL